MTGGGRVVCPLLEFQQSTLLCLSSRVHRYCRRAERAVDAAGQIAFDATTNFLVRTTLGASLLHVPAGFAVMGHPDDRDNV